jgi:hypothetical protein
MHILSLQQGECRLHLDLSGLLLLQFVLVFVRIVA